jgi:hypothetical protein
MRALWQYCAKASKKRCLVFGSAAELEDILPEIDPKTPIYLDSTLTDGTTAEIYSKILFDQGYRELYLSTGYEPSHFGDLPWVKAILGKDPPF